MLMMQECRRRGWRAFAATWIAPLVIAGSLSADPPVDIPAPPTARQIATAPAFAPDQPVVATHYFYWYRWPNEHFFDNRNTHDDALRQHPPDHRAVSYTSAAWHRRQMEDLRAAGIDVALLIYWGAPNQYEKPDIRFSVHGITPLVEALDAMPADDRPRIGLFYDTSTLLACHAFAEPRDTNVDLRTAEGRDIFYRTIRDFFALVPPRHWACLDGRPLVQLYGSGFAAGHDQQLFDYVYEHFARDFAGRRPFIVSGPSWHANTDAKTGWGAALGGPIINGRFVQIGPGYDDSPVPGRATPTRDRLGGGFYRASWLLALQAHPRLVIIETWNELHEGTGICETLEDGRFYIDLTRHFTDLLRAGVAPAQDGWAATVQALLHARHSHPGDREYASRLVLGCTAADDGTLTEDGLQLIRGVADGVCELGRTAKMPCLQTRRGPTEHRYVYFDVADPYYYDQHGTLTVRFTYFDEGTQPILLQYDSTDDTGTLADCYKELPQRVTRTNSRTWKTAVLRIPDARCANRQNGGADFRLLSFDSDLALRSVEVSKLPDDYAD